MLDVFLNNKFSASCQPKQPKNIIKLCFTSSLAHILVSLLQQASLCVFLWLMAFMSILTVKQKYGVLAHRLHKINVTHREQSRHETMETDETDDKEF